MLHKRWEIFFIKMKQVVKKEPILTKKEKENINYNEKKIWRLLKYMNSLKVSNEKTSIFKIRNS